MCILAEERRCVPLSTRMTTTTESLVVKDRMLIGHRIVSVPGVETRVFKSHNLVGIDTNGESGLVISSANYLQGNESRARW